MTQAKIAIREAAQQQTAQRLGLCADVPPRQDGPPPHGARNEQPQIQ